jgi:hypothetical protein
MRDVQNQTLQAYSKHLALIEGKNHFLKAYQTSIPPVGKEDGS